jgi:hypothetical protein
MVHDDATVMDKHQKIVRIGFTMSLGLPLILAIALPMLDVLITSMTNDNEIHKYNFNNLGHLKRADSEEAVAWSDGFGRESKRVCV